MGCGSSSALASASLVRSNLMQHTVVKDAGSQTNVTVLISSTPRARQEAHDARKEQMMLHRAEVLARAQEISNSKSGYTTATYTGSGISTPRSAYSRTRKVRNSDAGSGSDGGLGSNINLSRTDLSTHSSGTRKTQVSFRNEEYLRQITNKKNKRRKSYSSRSKVHPTKAPAHQVVSNNCNHSESGSSNSLNKQADTGYDGSVSSGPSSSTLVKGSSEHNAIQSNCDSTVTENEKKILSTVVSVDENSIVREDTNIVSLNDPNSCEIGPSDLPQQASEALSYNDSVKGDSGHDSTTKPSIPSDNDSIDRHHINKSDETLIQNDLVSKSSSSNSLNKQADTGYNGSVSSEPSSSTLVKGSSENNEIPANCDETTTATEVANTLALIDSGNSNVVTSDLLQQVGEDISYSVREDAEQDSNAAPVTNLLTIDGNHIEKSDETTRDYNLVSLNKETQEDNASAEVNPDNHPGIDSALSDESTNVVTVKTVQVIGEESAATDVENANLGEAKSEGYIFVASNTSSTETVNDNNANSELTMVA